MPTYVSGPNPVEIWFPLSTKDVVRGGLWRSEKELGGQTVGASDLLTETGRFRWTYDRRTLAYEARFVNYRTLAGGGESALVHPKRVRQAVQANRIPGLSLPFRGDYPAARPYPGRTVILLLTGFRRAC